jgi:hypothetical protein
VREAKSPPDPSPLIGGCGFSNGPHPSFPHRPTGSALISLSLHMTTEPHQRHDSLPALGICGEISAPHVATAIPETLHNVTSAAKRKNCKSGINSA